MQVTILRLPDGGGSFACLLLSFRTLLGDRSNDQWR